MQTIKSRLIPQKKVVMWIGFRGFPHVQGGVESHAEQICERLATFDWEVHAVTRGSYQPESTGALWNGVRLHRIYAPKAKPLETIVHSLLAVLYACFIKRPDILHIQSIGPAVWTPLARVFGLKVVLTTHGIDYERDSWNLPARLALKLGEYFGARWSNGRIAISERIQTHIESRYRVNCERIPNGVTLPTIATDTSLVRQFGLIPGKYLLIVSRLVVEKRHHDLVEAFLKADLGAEWKLVIAGSSDHPSPYSESLETLCSQSPNVVMTGFQTGRALRELYSHAHAFVLPSSHEGMPIALLEALSYGLPVIASDISANRELGLPEASYFETGNITHLVEKLRSVVAHQTSAAEREATRQWVASTYSWHDIAKRTEAVYRKVLQSKAGGITTSQDLDGHHAS